MLTDNFNYFLVKWQITTQCNFRCSYCTQVESDKRKVFSEDTAISRAKKLKEILLKVEKPIKLVLAGGELSIIKNLIEILNALYVDNLKSLEFYTNFSNTELYYKELIKWCEDHKIELLFCASFHEEFAEEAMFFKKYESLEKSLENSFIECVVTSKNCDYMKELRKRHKDLKIRFDPNKNESISSIDFDFSEEELSRFKSQQQNMQGKTCYQHGLLIKSDGRLFANNCKLVQFGNIDLLYNTEEILKEHLVTCSKSRCPMCHIQRIE